MRIFFFYIFVSFFNHEIFTGGTSVRLRASIVRFLSCNMHALISPTIGDNTNWNIDLNLSNNFDFNTPYIYLIKKKIISNNMTYDPYE